MNFFVWTTFFAIGIAVIPIVMWMIRQYLDAQQKRAEDYKRALLRQRETMIIFTEPKILPIPDEWKPEPQRTARTPYMWMDE